MKTASERSSASSWSTELSVRLSSMPLSSTVLSAREELSALLSELSFSATELEADIFFASTALLLPLPAWKPHIAANAMHTRQLNDTMLCCAVALFFLIFFKLLPCWLSIILPLILSLLICKMQIRFKDYHNTFYSLFQVLFSRIKDFLHFLQTDAKKSGEFVLPDLLLTNYSVLFV